MKRIPLILLIAGLLIWTILYIRSGISRRKKSIELVTKFKEIDSSLNLSKKSVDVMQDSYITASLKTDLVLLIDSLKGSYERIPESSKSLNMSKELKLDLNRLLKKIQEFNKLKWNMVDSKIPDTIKYWWGSDKFTEQKWNSTYFELSPKEASITYLNYIRKQVLNPNN